MLVLSRKNQESVVIGGVDGFEQLFKVTVLNIQHGKVRLGFEVDPSVPVHRFEVWDRLRAKEPADDLSHGAGSWSPLAPLVPVSKTEKSR